MADEQMKLWSMSDMKAGSWLSTLIDLCVQSLSPADWGLHQYHLERGSSIVSGKLPQKKDLEGED